MLGIAVLSLTSATTTPLARSYLTNAEAVSGVAIADVSFLSIQSLTAQRNQRVYNVMLADS